MPRSERDFDEEIRSHLEMETERLRATGLSAEEAERAARRNFGNVGVARDRFRDARAFAFVDRLGRDLSHAWRGLAHAPGFLVTCVGTLALAIGAVAGMFSVVNTVLLRPLPFPDPDRIVGVSGTAPGSDLPERFDVGAEFYLHYKERSKLLEGIFLFGSGTSIGANAAESQGGQTSRTSQRVWRWRVRCGCDRCCLERADCVGVGRSATAQSHDHASDQDRPELE